MFKRILLVAAYAALMLLATCVLAHPAGEVFEMCGSYPASVFVE
jgi:hypothetical protein